jgi:hypothetical protein
MRHRRDRNSALRHKRWIGPHSWVIGEIGSPSWETGEIKESSLKLQKPEGPVSEIQGNSLYRISEGALYETYINLEKFHNCSTNLPVFTAFAI